MPLPSESARYWCIVIEHEISSGVRGTICSCTTRDKQSAKRSGQSDAELKNDVTSVTATMMSLQVLGKNKDGGAARLGASDQEEPGADIFLHSPPANTRMGRRPAELDPAARRQSDTLYRLLDSQVSLILHSDALVNGSTLLACK